MSSHDGYGFGLTARRFDGTGSEVGSELVVNAVTETDQHEPHITVAPGDELAA